MIGGVLRNTCKMFSGLLIDARVPLDWRAGDVCVGNAVSKSVLARASILRCARRTSMGGGCIQPVQVVENCAARRPADGGLFCETSETLVILALEALSDHSGDRQKCKIEEREIEIVTL